MKITFRVNRQLFPGEYIDHIIELKKLPAFTIKKVIFNDPATIIFWEDGTKTVVKCSNEEFDPEKGLAMAICKKIYGNEGNYYNIFKTFLPIKEEEKPEEQPEALESNSKYEEAIVDALFRHIFVDSEGH